MPGAPVSPTRTGVRATSTRHGAYGNQTTLAPTNSSSCAGLVAAEPILTVNMGTGSADEAAAWVEYCNGGAETEHGALRSKNGHPEPYGVTTWFVGNEQFGNWQVGHVDAETYARKLPRVRPGDASGRPGANPDRRWCSH